MRRRDATGPSEQGQSLVTSVATIAVFLGFLMVAVHVCVGLYADSTVTAGAYDAARRVARADASDDRTGAARAAEADLRANLGRYAERIEDLDWAISDDVVELHIVVDTPSLLVFGEVGGIGAGRIDRTVRVRVEEVR